MTNKPFVYSKRMRISSADMNLLHEGRKRCTIRLGSASVKGDRIMMSDGRQEVEVRIVQVDNNRRFGDLGDEDARNEGFGNRQELVADLRRFYPRAADEDPVTIIYFEKLI